MTTILTVDQIKEKFDAEWVLLGNPVTDSKLNVLSGELLHHSPNREEIYRMAVTVRPKRSAVLYMGEMPKGTAIVL